MFTGREKGNLYFVFIYGIMQSRTGENVTVQILVGYFLRANTTSKRYGCDIGSLRTTIAKISKTYIHEFTREIVRKSSLK